MRDGVAADHLKGQVAAEKFLDGVEQAVKTPFLDLTLQAADNGLATQLLFGEHFTVYGYSPETGKVWGQSKADGYVGFVDPGGLADPGPHDGMVTTSFGPVYSSAEVKARPIFILPFGSQLPLGPKSGDFNATLGGFIHDRNIDALKGDLAGVAERFLAAPYLWGGRTGAGLDCSALVQLSAMALGQACPRDSDMQWANFGDALQAEAPLQRNDCVFWKGHVGIMADDKTLLHANAHHMAVVKEPLAEVLTRIEAAGEGPHLGAKRPAT